MGIGQIKMWIDFKSPSSKPNPSVCASDEHVAEECNIWPMPDCENPIDSAAYLTSCPVGKGVCWMLKSWRLPVIFPSISFHTRITASRRLVLPAELST